MQGEGEERDAGEGGGEAGKARGSEAPCGPPDSDKPLEAWGLGGHIDNAQAIGHTDSAMAEIRHKDWTTSSLSWTSSTVSAPTLALFWRLLHFLGSNLSKGTVSSSSMVNGWMLLLGVLNTGHGPGHACYCWVC